MTGDRKWQDKGWRMFTSWIEASLTKFGFADIVNVHVSPPELRDSMESFVFAETFKYYYLLV
jgi:mannosyl-oligosaccharide alpha-1,2-mannosidase